MKAKTIESFYKIPNLNVNIFLYYAFLEISHEFH